MIKHFLFLTALLIGNLSEAQKLIQLPPGLDTATPMQVRWKSGIGFPRYEFGSYRLINGKEKWIGTSTETEGGLLHDMLSTMRDVNQYVRSRRSFQLVNNQGDTGTVNMAITTVTQFEQYKKGLLGNQYESQRFEGAYTTWIAAIETPDTTQHWLLTAFQHEENIGLNFSKTSPLQASLKNGNRQLDVVHVQHYANGKKAWDVLGFIITESGVPLNTIFNLSIFLIQKNKLNQNAMKKPKNLKDFKIEELEQRLEMDGTWGPPDGNPHHTDDLSWKSVALAVGTFALFLLIVL